MMRVRQSAEGWVWRLLPGPTGFGDLSDDLLARVLAELDCSQLRACAGVCRRWAELCRTRLELWATCDFALPPKRSRGRDRWARAGDGRGGHSRLRRRTPATSAACAR